MSGDPLGLWRGTFGDEYIGRNPVTSKAVTDAANAFGRILDASEIRRDVASVLEVGANVGINLRALRTLLGTSVVLAALEPNPTACVRLREDPDLKPEAVIEGDAYQIPLPDRSYDLIFTRGVLIHIPPHRLSEAMREICRVARRWVLCIEYFSETPVEASYRRHAGLLWKCDFGRAYLDACPELATLRYGFVWEQDLPNFGNVNWWLFTKRRA